MTAGERIKMARDRAGLTQEQFASRLGITKGAVSQWESGRTEPRNKMFKTIAMVTGVSLSWLVGSGNEGFNEVDSSLAASDKPDLAPAEQGIPVYRQEKDLSIDPAGDKDEVFFTIPCPPQLVSVRDAYAVLVSGSSMSPRYEDNEIVIIDPLRQVQQGNYVAAIIRNAAGKAKIVIGQLVRHDEMGLVMKQLSPNVLLHFPCQDVVSVGFIAMSSVMR